MKKISYLAMALILMLFTVEVNALAADVDCITGAGSHTCTLSEDIEVSEQLKVQGQVVLDLNGHTIYATSTASFTTGVIGVKRGATLTIKDTVGNGKITTGDSTAFAAIAITTPGETKTGSKATLIVDGGTIEGYYYGIVGNGTRHNTSITVNGGTIRGLQASDNTGIFQPQEGTVTINGGTIQGTTGIEMRSGTLIVNGGVIEGTGAPVTVEANGSGSTTIGAGIAIAQHTTGKDIDVTVKGGTIRGYAALYESNPQNSATAAEKLNVNIIGGTFEAINGGTAAVYSEDATGFVKRGTFNTALASTYVSNDSDIKEVNGNYVIGSDNYREANDDTGYDMDTSYDSAEYVAPVETYDVNISWDDLHWVFVYEGNVSSPTKKVWVTKEYYDATKTANSHLTINELNGDILDNINNLPAPELGIAIENNSVFAVDIDASVENKSNDLYTTSAGLQIALESATNNVFANQANIDALISGGNANLLVKPTATRFVNDSGTTATVAGEVKITISKTN